MFWNKKKKLAAIKKRNDIKRRDAIKKIADRVNKTQLNTPGADKDFIGLCPRCNSDAVTAKNPLFAECTNKQCDINLVYGNGRFFPIDKVVMASVTALRCSECGASSRGIKLEDNVGECTSVKCKGRYRRFVPKTFAIDNILGDNHEL